MKKFFFLAAAVIAGSFAADAQEKQYKPEAMDFSLEMNYTPGLSIGTGGSGSGLVSLSNSTFSLPDYGLKGRFFITDRFAVKLNLGFSTDSDKSKEYTENTTGGVTSVTTTESKSAVTAFSIMPGVEYHFGDFKRVSPYIGAAIGFSAGSTVRKDVGGAVSTRANRPVFGFAVNAAAGVDVYICQGLYAGVELGLGYGLEKTGRGKTVSTDATGAKTETVGDTEDINNTFGFFATPSIRIGWFF